MLVSWPHFARRGSYIPCCTAAEGACSLLPSISTLCDDPAPLGCRIAPHVTITLVALDMLKKFEGSIGL